MRTTDRTFTAGEVSPAVSARVDLDWYNSALLKCENAYVRTQGGVFNREGTRFIGFADNNPPSSCRVVSFQINEVDSYIVVFTPNTIQVIGKTGFLISGGQKLKITTPFLDPWKIHHSSFASTLTMVDGIAPPQVLKIYSETDVRLEEIDFNVSAKKPKQIVLSASASTEQNKYRKYEYAVTGIDSDTDIESLALFKQRDFVKYLNSDTNPMKVTIHGEDSTKLFNVYKSLGSSSGIYGFIGSCHNSQVDSEGAKFGVFTDYNYAPDMALSPPLDNKPFEGVDDRPSTCGFYQQRRIFAATKANPQRVYCSETGDISSMRYSRPSKATDSISQDVISARSNHFRHVVNFGGFLLLGSSGESIVTEGSDYVLTPSSFGTKEVSSYGASNVKPVNVGTSLIFSQSNGGRLIALNIDSELAGQVSSISGNDISIRAEHLFNNRTVVDMAYDKEPYSIIWFVLDNGELMGLTYNKEQKVWGFHKHVTDGKFISVASSILGNRTTVVFVVERVLNGVKRFYLEYLEHREEDDVKECYFLDCGISTSGNAQITIVNNLAHLNGRTVTALADGVEVKGLVVASGRITLPNPATQIHVGLPYTTKLTTMPLDSIRNTTKGRRKAINSVVLELYKTRGVKAGATGLPLSELKPDKYESKFELLTSEQKVVLSRGWEKRGTIDIEHDSPVSFALLSITPEFDIE